MDAERWSRIQEVFEAAEALEGEARNRFLDKTCAGDPELLAEVRSLLDASTDADDFLGGMAREAGLELAGEAPEEPDVAGARFGPYRVVRLLGRGGMGAVYVAERDDEQFKMEVALKAVPGALQTPEARGRFLSERQILARLHHPNIAQLLDGGVSDDGVPYFVMELVDGRRIDEYCRDEGLGVQERIGLFLQVCEGVRHAHASLIVHRDLKPANILVTPDGVVKLLDFGIARALESEEALYQTALNAPHPMTLAYASPEQLKGEPPTTACDIYGLGLLLYRLLTDRHPYEFEPGSSYPQIQEIVCDTNPRPPSRAQEPSAPDQGTLSRDLDAVVLKALAKEPERRYRTVAELGEDLERYLGGRPVHARPDTLGYRVRRFVGRNRAAVTFGTVVALLAASLLGLGIQYAVDTRAQADALAQEVRTTQAVSDFVVGLFAAANPGEGGSDTLSAGTLLARGVERIDGDLGDAPVVRARVLTTLASVYGGLGYRVRSDSLGWEGLLLHRDVQGPDHPETLSAALSLAGRLRQAQNDNTLPRAEVLYQEVLDLTRDRPDLMEQHISAQKGLADLRVIQGRPEEALPLILAALDDARGFLDPTDERFLSVQQGLARVYRDVEKPDSAELVFREVLEAYDAIGPEADSQASPTRVSLAILLRRQGRLDEAAAEYRTVLDRYPEVLGREGARVVHNNLVSVLVQQEKWDDAVLLLREWLAQAREYWPPDQWQVGAAYSGLGEILLRAGRPGEAEPMLRSALDNYETGLGPSHGWTARVRGLLGTALVRLGRYDEGEAALLQARDDLQAGANPNRQDLQMVEEALEELRAAAA